MRDLAPTLNTWIEEGRRFALATVLSAKGSSPRGVGSCMAVREDGLIAGSVSGGCVEGAVVEAALRALKNGKAELLEFGSTSEAVLFEVGLSCGGEIRVWVEPVVEGSIREAVEGILGRKPVLRISKLLPQKPKTCYYVGEAIAGNPFWTTLQDTVGYDVHAGTVEMGGNTYFVELLPVPERLVLIGAVHIAVALVGFAKALGLEVAIVDPRAAFAAWERFPIPPDRLIQAWPDKSFEELGIDHNTFVVTLSHDPKIDDPALFAAIRGGAGYVGALGGTKTQAKKRETLKELGLSIEDLDKIHGPVGLDIGAQTPEEIALSILAEIVKVRRG